MTKQRRRPFPCQALYHVQEQLELVHDDLGGPVKPAILGERRYFLLLVDNTSRIIWTVLLPTKGALADAIKQI